MSKLKLESLVKTFGATEVLRGISTSFEPGTVTAIVGDNGAGKSTLCKIISGVYHPDSGSIVLGNLSLGRLGPHATRTHGIEMIYQDLAMAKQHDVVSNLFFGRELTSAFGLLDRKAMKTKATDILREIGIKIDNLNQPVESLSGGQQQALAIARALLFNPKVLIMDEPTAALAAREIEHILEIVRTLKSKGLIVLLISHRLNDVFAVSDRVLALRSGKIAFDRAISDTTMQEVVEQIMID